ncbi:hypothetical protein [Myxococcus landrumensis]|uniref:Uncharacterized protein n=1 Tax=Myxococcus landrumensis TaxID=2813577 RepID=A0ABX7NEZ3_9BACT|nr:hypothetical protein [Myxococcus landrumus]QSQ16069.1 hypothetical protein JY572_08475 [Myxococcus landrumus]
MSEQQSVEVCAKALALIRSHFTHLNDGRLEAAGQQLLFPSGGENGRLAVYVHEMSKLAPFRLLTTSIRRFEGVCKRRHGTVATVLVDVRVSCSPGERDFGIMVEWFPKIDVSLISIPPTKWFLEKPRRDDAALARCAGMTQDEKLIEECLRAAVDGPFFPDWEFHALFGLYRREVAAVLESWPRSDHDNNTRLAIHSALCNLTGYPLSKSMAVWPNFISVSREELSDFFDRWLAAQSPA